MGGARDECHQFLFHHAEHLWDACAAGRLVSLVDPAGVDRLQSAGIKAHYVFVAPCARELTKIAELIEQGRLRTFIGASFPLAQAAQAHALIETNHVRGKIVLKI